MSYDVEELELKNNSDQEQARTRRIFEDLKSKAENREKLTEHEKDFFCSAIRLSRMNDGSMDEYDCCANFKFKELYLTYFKVLLGLSKYRKVKGHVSYEVDNQEIKNDLAYLSKVEKEWLSLIDKTNHSEELLQQISKETRKELEKIKKTTGRDSNNRNQINDQRKVRSVILQSKYIYLTALKIYEILKPTDFVFSLNGNFIEITEYSIVHILNRHFAQITKPDSKKSFHNTDFKPKYLTIQLKKIFEEIDKSGLLYGMPINKIAFMYKGVSYQVWINKRYKQIKGKGNVKINRLETFYPIEEYPELLKIQDDNKLIKISKDLSIYIEKTD